MLSTIAIFIIIIIMVLYLFNTKADESFVSKRAYDVHKKSNDLFKNNNNASYTEFKNKLPQSDPVLYSDVRSLWTSGKFNPINVQKIL